MHNTPLLTNTQTELLSPGNFLLFVPHHRIVKKHSCLLAIDEQKAWNFPQMLL